MKADRNQPNADAKKKMILVVSQAACTYESIIRMLSDADIEVATADSLASSLERMRLQDVSVVLCDRDVPAGGWKAVLAALETMPEPPLLIVTATDADDKLWAEVLNLGGYDVLAQPLDPTEVQRILIRAHEVSGPSLPTDTPPAARETE